VATVPLEEEMLNEICIPTDLTGSSGLEDIFQILAADCFVWQKWQSLGDWRLWQAPMAKGGPTIISLKI
jgi:hypothetical protein